MAARERPIGFRLLNELEGLLHGVAADQVIVEEEFRRIERWLLEAKPFRHVYPFSSITDHLDRALSDGILTLEECQDLLFACESLTSYNPHFDQLRAGVQQLTGLITGISADCSINALEIDRLDRWTRDWVHMKGLWPFDECEALVEAMRSGGSQVEAADRMLQLAEQFPIGGHVDLPTGEIPPLLLNGICAVDPSIEFIDRRFVFTGTSSRCEREVFHALVEERGGTATKSVSARTNYVIVCDEGSPFWAFSCYGRKVQDAYNLRRAGQTLVIAHEVDFWRAVE